MRYIGASGVIGALLLVVYFAAPALLDWPFAGATADRLAAYATSHETLFYVGAWLQVTGTVLSVVFFLGILTRADALGRLSGIITVVSAAGLLAVVLVEAAFMMAVPPAARAGDTATLVTAFTMSNGGFVRVFSMAPASVTYIGLGAALAGSTVLPRPLAYLAMALGGAFELDSVLSLFTQAGLFLAIVLSVIQATWIIAAGLVAIRRG